VVEISTGVAVVADDTWTAIRGRDALLIEWDEPPNAGLTSAALRMAQLNAVDHGRAARREGVAVDLALARAARVMDATYVTPFQAHAAMEPLNCIADVRAGACEIWVGTQAPNQAQEQVARMLAIPIDQVRIHVTLLGSSFGRRLDIDYIVEAVELSRAAHVPVQVVWTREDDMRHDRYQPGQVNRLTAGLDASGTPVAWRHRVADYHLTMFGPYDPRYDPAASGDPWGGIDTPYNFPSLDVTLAALESPVPTGSWRSVSYPAAVFARECFIDEVAHATGRDPLALRLALLPSPGAHHQGDTTRPNGDRLRRVLELAAAAAGWGASQRPPDSERRWGHGIACNSYQSETMVAQVAEVSVGRGADIRVHRVVCAIDCGQVINRLGLEGQCESGVNWGVSAALNGAVTFSNGRTDQSNFHDFPVLRMKDAPAIEVHVVDSELGPFGAGEPPVPPVAPAIANAVFHATGTRLRELPLRLSSGGSPSRGRE
jgi:isoquinoline 1-oxidoreductase beta subunit